MQDVCQMAALLGGKGEVTASWRARQERTGTGWDTGQGFSSGISRPDNAHVFQEAAFDKDDPWRASSFEKTDKAYSS